MVILLRRDGSLYLTQAVPSPTTKPRLDYRRTIASDRAALSKGPASRALPHQLMQSLYRSIALLGRYADRDRHWCKQKLIYKNALTRK